MTPTALLGAGEAARLVLEARDRGEASVSALVLTGPARGRRMVLVGPSASTLLQRHGSLGAPELEGEVEEEATRLLASATGEWAGTRELSVPVYVEIHHPPEGLLIVGAGHLASPLHELGARLGFRVTVVDDRPTFVATERFPQAHHVLRVDFRDPFREIPPGHRTHVLLVTRGHRYDYECIRLLLREKPLPRYLGMIGSRRRVRATFHQLVEEGIPREHLMGIRAPVGLDVGAETPEEIAVAVAAEWIQLRRGGTGRPLSQVERVAERFFPEEA